MRTSRTKRTQRKPPALSEYKAMWVIAMFDLPVDDAEDRKQYTRFRKVLLAEGFSALQYSVYARYCESEEAATAFRRRLRLSLPPEGEVRLLAITDRQFGKMEVYTSRKRKKTEQAPPQLLLF